MKLKINLLLVSLFMCLTLFSNELDYARTVFHTAKKISEIDAALEKIANNTSATVIAYKGAFTMMKAKYVFSPIIKYKNFEVGKTLVEQAILMDGKNLEIRYLRCLLQSNCPKFLGYNQHIKQDINFILTTIITDNNLNLTLKHKIITNLVDVNLITYKQKQLVFSALKNQNYARTKGDISR